MARKKHVETSEPPKVDKRPNKRIVFHEEDSDEQPEKEDFFIEPVSKKPKTSTEIRESTRTKSDQLPKHTNQQEIRLPPFTPHKTPNFWNFLQIRDPFPLFHCLPPRLFPQRALLHFIRELCEQLLRNFEQYQKNELLALGASSGALRAKQLLSSVEEMSQKTMKVEVGGVSVVLETGNFLNLIRGLLNGRAVKLNFYYCTALHEQLRGLFELQKVEISEPDLIITTNAFIRYLIHVQLDFINSLVIFNAYNSIEKRPFLELIPQNGYLLRSSPSDLLSYSLLPELTFQSMTRSVMEASLWCTIPCEGRARLLEHVFTKGLLECLPEIVREFLTIWMQIVKGKMRKRMKNKEFMREISELLHSDSQQIQWSVIREIIEGYQDVLNTVKFRVFNENWLHILLHTLRDNNDPDWTPFIEDIATSSEFSHLESLLPESDASYHLLRHVKIHLFNFFLKFCYHTIRMLFIVDIKKRVMRYDGVVEFRKTPNYKSIDEEEKALHFKHEQLEGTTTKGGRKSLLMMSSQNQKDAQNAPTHPESYPKIPFFPIHPSPIYTPPFATKKEPTPSEGSLQMEEEDEGVPKKWRDAYRLLLEWNQELVGQLNSVKDRFHKFC